MNAERIGYSVQKNEIANWIDPCKQRRLRIAMIKKNRLEAIKRSAQIVRVYLAQAKLLKSLLFLTKGRRLDIIA